MKGRRKLIGFGVVCALLGAGVWYAVQAGWFEDELPTNLPTAEEIERMREIERSSAQVAPNARAGAGVFAPGTLPPPVLESTSTEATTTESTEPAE